MGIKYCIGKKGVFKVIKSQAVKGLSLAILRIFRVIVRIIDEGEKCVRMISKKDFC